MSKQEHTLTIQQALDLALQNHKAGRLKQTKLICYQVLQNDPNQHMALHLLGMIEHQTGKLENAVASYHKVLNIKPDYAEAHNNLGVALQHLGKVEEALQRIEKETFGYCEECGQKIDEKRLLIQPVTTYCIICKESLEAEEDNN